MKNRVIQTFEAVWTDIAIAVAYEPDWLSLKDGMVAHIEVRSIQPEREPLPITETGYKSHFTGRQNIEALGGPVAYVLAWLDAEAKSAKWRAADAARRQLSLF